MNELDLYKFVHEQASEYHRHVNDEGVLEEITMFFSPLYLDKFLDMFTREHFDDDPITCWVRKDSVCVEMLDICERYDIDENRIFE